jgi:hypothetical protein
MAQSENAKNGLEPENDMGAVVAKYDLDDSIEELFEDVLVGKKFKRGGSKLGRTETVSIRLDPKLRYLAELAARKQRRSLSSFIEWAVEYSLSNVELYHGSGYNGDDSYSILEVAQKLWSVDSMERLIRLAIHEPSLMTFENQEMWQFLNDAGLLEPARSRARDGVLVWDWEMLEEVIFPFIRGNWSNIATYFIDDSKRGIAAWMNEIRAKLINDEVYFRFANAKRSRNQSNLDDEIPF